MGSKKNVDMSTEQTEVKIIESQVEGDTAVSADGSESSEAVAAPVKAKKAHQRSKKYQSVRSQVDKTKAYDTFAAVELIKKLSYSRFPGTMTADIVTKEVGTSVTLSFPHSTGKTFTVAIVSDEVIADIEAGNINFDVLITEPQFMPKLAKLARVLGPKGLMPNPKNGTITDNPERRKKELEGGQVTLKTEKKAPLIHVSIGKTDMETKDLVENLNALIKAVEGKAVKLNLTATMSPSLKVAIA
jgi:large subunit ribosomal protein L1